MAETVYLKDGTTEYIFDEKDVFLERLIREKLGDDAARCFRDFVEERLQDAKDWEAQAVDNEKIADGYRQMCCDAKEALQNIHAELSADHRLNREKLKRLAFNAYDDLHKNL